MQGKCCLLITATNNPLILDNFGCTPINYADSNGHFEVVQLLMSATDNPNTPANNELTPQNLAYIQKHYKIVYLFINAKFLKYISF